MEVKPGSKQTEVGVIPQDWDVGPLSRVIERLNAGVSVNSVDEQLRTYGHDELILKTSAISDGKFIPHESKKILPRDVSRASLNPQSDTIIISRMNTPELVGECGYVETDYPHLFLPDRLWMTHFRGNQDICVRWLNYLLSSQPYKTRIKGLATGTSGSMKNIAKDALLAMPVAYPQCNEQEAIAEALNDADALIESLEQLLAKKRQLKQGAMQELLMGKKRLPGFSGEWEVKGLGEIADVKTGPFGSSLHESDYVQDGTPIITVEHLGEFGVTHFNLPLVSDSDRQRLRAYSLEIGDIVFSRVGSIDRNALIRKEEEGWLFSGRLLRVRPDKQRAVAPFLSYQFHGEGFKALVRNVAVGQTMASLNTQILKGIAVVLPSLPEQAAIAAILSDMDAEIVALEAKVAKARQLKQGMMQELLTGKIRLVHPPQSKGSSPC